MLCVFCRAPVTIRDNAGVPRVCLMPYLVQPRTGPESISLPKRKPKFSSPPFALVLGGSNSPEEEEMDMGVLEQARQGDTHQGDKQ